MVVTRSGVTTKATPKKIVFLEDGENPEGEFLTADEDSMINDQQSEEDIEEDSDEDSDDAPEEESTSTIKKTILQKQEEAKKIKQEEKRIQREKRKQQQEHNAQQQELKKIKIKTSIPDELPDYLPEDLLESYTQEVEEKPKNTHIRLDIADEKEARRQAKLQKLANLKKSKKFAINKGPVHVQVQSITNKKAVPKAEAKVINSREKWLKRKSLNKV